jgi:hypothetical protein
MKATTGRRLGVSVLAAGVVLAAAGCGSSKKSDTGSGGTSAPASAGTSTGSSGGSGDAQSAFAKAVDNLASGDAATVSLKVGATADQIKAFAQATGASAKDIPSDDALALITGSSFQITTKAESGSLKDAASSGKTDTDVSVNVGGNAVFDVRYIGSTKTAYLKVDVPKIASLAHTQVPASIASLGASPQFPFLKDALAGKWIELDGLSAVAKQFAGLAGASASAAPSVSTDLAAKLLNTLTGDVTATDQGSTSDGEHLVLTAPLQKLATDFQTIVSEIPGGSLAGSKLSDLSNVPAKNVTIDAYVKDDKLTKLGLDIIQFAPAADAAKVAGQHLSLELAFSGSAGDTSAPSGATKVDLGQLVQQFGSFLPGLSGAGSSG